MPADLRSELRDGVLWATMVRPDVHNALDLDMIHALRALFERAASDAAVRAVVLTGEGPSFSAGADLALPQRGGLSYDQHLADALELGALCADIEQCPRPVLACVQGSAFADGAGLAAKAELTVASANALFGFTEVGIGPYSPVSAPYVIRRIGEGAARRLFLTGERITAAEAQTLGLAHRVAQPDELDRIVEEELEALLAGGPQAQAEIKDLLIALRDATSEQAQRLTALRMAAARTAAEGQTGLRALLDQRPAPWQRKRRAS